MSYKKKYEAIEKLYMSYFNTDLNPDVFSEEFFYFTGEILKGENPKNLKSKILEEEIPINDSNKLNAEIILLKKDKEHIEVYTYRDYKEKPDENLIIEESQSFHIKEIMVKAVVNSLVSGNDRIKEFAILLDERPMLSEVIDCSDFLMRSFRYIFPQKNDDYSEEILRGILPKVDDFHKLVWDFITKKDEEYFIGLF